MATCPYCGESLKKNEDCGFCKQTVFSGQQALVTMTEPWEKAPMAMVVLTTEYLIVCPLNFIMQCLDIASRGGGLLEMLAFGALKNKVFQGKYKHIHLSQFGSVERLPYGNACAYRFVRSDGKDVILAGFTGKVGDAFENGLKQFGLVPEEKEEVALGSFVCQDPLTF